PQEFASADIVAARITARAKARSFLRVRADNHYLSINSGRRADAVQRAGKVAGDTGLEVDRPVVAEACDGKAGLRIERDQSPVAGAEQDAWQILAIAGPVRYAAHFARVRLWIELPNLLTGLGLKRHDLLILRREVKDTAGDDRRNLKRTSALAGVIGPNTLETAHVLCVDLIERRIAGSTGIAAVQRP